MINTFDKTEFYKETLQPILSQLKMECASHNVPFFVTVVTKNSEAGTEYHSDMVLASAKTQLADDRISKMLLHMRGFPTVLPERVKKAEEILEDYMRVMSSKEMAADTQLQTDHLQGLKGLSKNIVDLSYDLEEI